MDEWMNGCAFTSKPAQYDKHVVSKQSHTQSNSTANIPTPERQVPVQHRPHTHLEHPHNAVGAGAVCASLAREVRYPVRSSATLFVSCFVVVDIILLSNTHAYLLLRDVRVLKLLHSFSGIHLLACNVCMYSCVGFSCETCPCSL
jgi:hypothetical protein